MEEERQYNLSQASYWEIVLEDATKTVEYARKQRLYYMQCLGMIALEQ